MVKAESAISAEQARTILTNGQPIFGTHTLMLTGLKEKPSGPLFAKSAFVDEHGNRLGHPIVSEPLPVGMKTLPELTGGLDWETLQHKPGKRPALRCVIREDFTYYDGGVPGPDIYKLHFDANTLRALCGQAASPVRS